MTAQPTEGRLRVPGTILYYKTQGSGPVLLILQGGAGDADGSDSLAQHLVDHYTVVSYDRRGLSRSALDDDTQALRIEIHGDDAHHLLAALTTDPAFVLGISIGALIGLDLVGRHPNQVRTLVAHEPPAPDLLPEDERVDAKRSQEKMEEIFHREGVPAAMKSIAAMAGLNFEDREPDVALPQPNAQRAVDMTFFLSHDAAAVRRYRLDIDALTSASARIVAAAGRTSPDAWPHHAARALAGRIGARFVEFPGGHNGYVFHPRGFAATLRDVFDGRSDGTAGAWETGK
jgi:pimeloyl-ACP methyl ester carboxylesterase